MVGIDPAPAYNPDAVDDGTIAEYNNISRAFVNRKIAGADSSLPVSPILLAAVL